MEKQYENKNILRTMQLKKNTELNSAKFSSYKNMCVYLEMQESPAEGGRVGNYVMMWWLSTFIHGICISSNSGEIPGIYGSMSKWGSR